MGLLDTPSKALADAGSFINNPFGGKKVKSSIRAHDFPNGFIMTPIIDGKEDTANAVALLGNMMPHIPFAFGGEQREVKDFYPGNPEPVLHILGGQETDITVKGRLYSKKYNKPEFYEVPMEMAEKIDAIRLAGNLVKFSLGDWTRYGILKRTSFPMKGLGDLEYELTLSITGFFLPKFAQTIDQEKRIPFDINNDLIAKALEFQSTYTQIPSSVPQSLADILNGAISDVAGAISAATGFIDTALTAVENVAASYNRALGTVKYALISLIRFRRRIASLSSNLAITSSTLTMAGKMNASSHFSGAISSSISLSLLLEQIKKRFEQLIQSTPLARHRVHPGDTLQRIATKWYGSPDNWKLIMDHNKLTTTALTDGAVLEIPRL